MGSKAKVFIILLCVCLFIQSRERYSCIYNGLGPLISRRCWVRLDQIRSHIENLLFSPRVTSKYLAPAARQFLGGPTGQITSLENLHRIRHTLRAVQSSPMAR